MVYVYSVDDLLIFNASEFITTQFETTQLTINTTAFQSTLLSELNISDLNMTTTSYAVTPKPTDSITDKAKRFFNKLVPWMIAVIVIGAFLLCLLLFGLCALCFNRKNRNQECEKDTKEQVPMIVTNTVASQYIETTKSNKTDQQYTSKHASVPDDDDDQVYV